MNNCDKKTNLDIIESDSFQSFIKDGNIYVSDKINHYVINNTIYKYLPFEYFLNSYRKGYIYLSSPYKWDDPYEVKYLEMLENSDQVSEEMKLKVFATCFSSSTKNEEALWKVYRNKENDFVRLAIDYDKLLEQLKQNGPTKYFTAMQYKSRAEILETKYIVKECHKEDLFLNNFSMKQDAYEYEHEIRLCLLEEDSKLNSVSDHRKIENFNWKPVIKAITFPPIKEREREIYNAYHYYLTKKLGVDPGKIYLSQLYNKDEVSTETPYEPE